ncbi:hypothetical protein [Alkalicoccobacillus murimartini]|uniref:Uncharacterized protein n=1 Tax=Alkalicoccobacillus murimartini TaxID=171685 RepID=A0ABT9YDZ2_9BACI|nr:hypothetical protein [Alkalicoccobacillus murimartini]MDQ0205710.1 hypothetical protein [Alkalicoccobacillus murimartini]
MECICNRDIFNIKIEADIAADPFWCSHCGCNLDIDDFPLSRSLKKELINWVTEYGRWLDWSTEEWLPGGKKLEVEHNSYGLLLTEKVKSELGEAYSIHFSSSKMII